MSFIVYKASLNDKIKYIGITSKLLDYRKTDHFYSANKGNSKYLFHNAIRKHQDNIKFEPIEQVGTKEEAIFLEKYYIKHYDTFVKNGGYNLTLGGEGAFGLVLSEESKRKISVSKTGKKTNRVYTKRPPETLEKISKTLKGRPCPWKNVPIIDESGIVYKSLKFACETLNIKYSTMQACIALNRPMRNNKLFRYYAGSL